MQSRITAALILFFFFTSMAISLVAQSIVQNVDDLTECSAVAVYKYKGKSLIDSKPACKITVNRATPGSPLPVQVPPNTKVVVVVANQQANENIQFVVTNDAVARPDIAGGIINKLTGPLASLSFTQAYNNAVRLGALAVVLPIELQKRQKKVYDTLGSIYTGYIEPTCLQTFTPFDATQFSCSTTPFSDNSAFETARQKALVDVKAAIDTPLTDQVTITALDKDVSDTCNATSYPAGSDCAIIKDNELKIDALFGLLTAKAKPGTTLPTFFAALEIWQRTGDTKPVVYQQARDRKLTIKVNGIEQIGNTSTAVATVVVTWQQTNWSLSTGVVLSALKNKTYANSPLYNANGTVDTDSSGKALTQVTVAKTYPGIISPVFLVNYRLYNFQKSSGRFALLFSGGIGANIVTKSADFAGGPGLQWGSVIFSPVVHYGRQTQLTSGVQVGNQLGTSPPTLPTVNVYKPAIGFGITYRLPLP